MDKKDATYYNENAKKFGWGNEARLNPERLTILEEFLIGPKVLEVGCASGVLVDFLNKQKFEATGVDFVFEFIEAAKKNKKGTFIKADAEKLPFNDNAFDTVLLFDILEHGDDEVMLNEAKRVAKKRIIILVPHAVDEELSESGVAFRHYLDKSHLREYQETDLKQLMEKMHLEIIHLQKVDPLYNETIFSALFGGPNFLHKLVRKFVLLFLSPKKYFTEILVVADK